MGWKCTVSKKIAEYIDFDFSISYNKTLGIGGNNITIYKKIKKYIKNISFKTVLVQISEHRK